MFSRKMTSRREVRIDDPKKLAADFACSVTVYSSNHMHWVARNGEESVFRTLQRILPEVCKDQNVKIDELYLKSEKIYNIRIVTLSVLMSADCSARRWTSQAKSENHRP